MLHDCNLSEWTWRTLRPHIPMNRMVPLLVGETDFLGREIDFSLGARIAAGVVHPVLCVAWDTIKEVRYS